MPRTQKSKEKRKRKKEAGVKSRLWGNPHQYQKRVNASPAFPPNSKVSLLRAYEFSEIKSPVKHLLPHLRNLAARITPAKQKEAEQYCKEVTLRIINDGKWIFRYLINTKTIVLSRKALEILWASSHAYLTYFTDVVQAKKLLRSSVDSKDAPAIDLSAIPSVSKALALLDWAFNDWISETDTPWPQDLTKPIPNPITASPENWADELTLCAVAFLLHHELAHAYLSHEPAPAGFDSITLEREADYAAAAFLLSGAAPNDNFFIKKSLSIAVALSISIGRDIHTGYWGGDTHPRSFDRLVHVLDRFIVHDFPLHEAWIFSWSIIKLHIDGSRLANELIVNNQPAEIDSYRHLLELYIDALSKLPDCPKDGEVI